MRPSSPATGDRLGCAQLQLAPQELSKQFEKALKGATPEG
jgi:hypothetical protein